MTFAFSTQIVSNIQMFWDWILLIEFFIILYLLYKLLTCGDEETSFSFTPTQLLNKIKGMFTPTGPPPNMPDPNRSFNFSPTPPPNKGSKSPSPNKGDDPIPPKDPVFNEPKHKPLPGAPYYKPKKPKPPKEDRTLVDLSPWFLQVRNQDSLGACAAFAGSSIMEYIINRVTGHLNYNFKLSELFLWYNTRESKGENSGTVPADLMNWMLQKGDCKESLWSFEDKTSTKYLQEPTEVCFQDAPEQRALSIRNVSVDPDEWIRALLDEHPLFFGIETPQNFNESHLIGKPLFENPVWPSRGGHGMVIVGYDSHYPTPDGRKIEAFKVRNSWGELFGEDGYIWIPRNILRNMISRLGSCLYLIDGWNNNKANKKLFTVTGRAVFDGGHAPNVPHNWDGHKIVNSNDLKSPDHPFKVAIMAQIKGRPVFLPGAETIVHPEQDGMFKIQFTADPTQFEELTEFSRAFPMHFHNINFKKEVPGIVVVKKPAQEQNTDMKQWFFHITDFKYSPSGRGGEARENPINPRSDIATGKHIKYSGRPIQFGPNHTEEHNVVIPIIFYGGTEDAAAATGNAEERAKKEALEKIHHPAQKEFEWAQREFNLLEDMRSAILARNISKVVRQEKRISRAMYRLNREHSNFKKSIPRSIRNLPTDLGQELMQKKEDLDVAERKLLVFLQSRSKIATTQIYKQLSVRSAKNYLKNHHTEDTPEVTKAWNDLSSSLSAASHWLDSLVVTLRDIVDLTK